MTVLDYILHPLNVDGVLVDERAILRIADGFANLPHEFRAIDLVPLCPQPDGRNSIWWQQELLNRLMQRWRKLDLVVFNKGRWSLRRGAWGQFQMAGSRL